MDANPNSKIPALVDRSGPEPIRVFESGAILLYLAERFGAFLLDLEDVRQPDVRLLSGIDGATVFDARDGLDKLGKQVAETVDWAACMQACRAAGAKRALELGPGEALARMMGSVMGEGESRSFAEFRSVDGLLRWLRP